MDSCNALQIALIANCKGRTDQALGALSAWVVMLMGEDGEAIQEIAKEKLMQLIEEGRKNG